MYKNYERIINEKHLTSYKVSKETGVSQSILSAWKNGVSVPKIDKIEKIADYIGVTVEYLCGKDEHQKENFIEKLKKGFKIPILGIVPCGIPIEAIEDIIDYEEITEKMASGGTFYGLVAHGDSMAPNILEGDILIIKQVPCVDNGNIAIVKVNGDDATCKKIMVDDNGVTLIPTNSNYEPLRYSKEDVEKTPVTICGKVVEIRRKL